MLTIHRSERADYLLEALGDVLLEATGDPMVAEVVSVPTRGIERWLSQRLSHRLGAAGRADGVCANVEFPFPGSLINAATAVACGFDRDTDPWPPERSVWPLLELVDENLADPFLAPLAAHLRGGSPSGEEETSHLRRFATVRHLADLYDRYAVHRPEMVKSWASGDDGPVGSSADDAGPSAGASWQPELWRRLRRRIGVASPVERLDIARSELVAHPHLLDLPPRLSLFGLTRLPASYLLILEAIAAHRDVHLFLLHPSGRLWERVEDAAASVTHPLRRRDDPTVSFAENGLLRSWGRDAREMQLVLEAHGVVGGDHRPVPEVAESERPTLLQLLQADIRADRQPPGAPRSSTLPDPRPILGRNDDSLRVHACHGRLRQVEVMRDAILHLLAADPTLEARDVIVMCPDIESFAPLIQAVLGSRDHLALDDLDEDEQREPGPPLLRVRLADRSIRQTNPILAVAAQLLELADSRVTASELLDLAGYEPVGRRFRFDKEDLGQLERWVAATGVRWGLDGEHRRPWKLDRVDENTWRAGLDRLLLGVAMADENQRLVGGVLPFDDVPSGAVDLAGRFAELVERVQSAVDSLRGQQSVAAWCGAIAEATESLALAGAGEQWQHDQLRRVLGEVADTTGHTAGAPLLDLAEVRSLLADRLRGRPTRANFRTGDLTICTLVPMRSVPHRVVGLLGLDDGVFPRHGGQDGDDLLLVDPHVGDRDGRSEDRQLLLDALLAATQHLVLTYEGRDPRTNQERSPCVPISELLDVVDRTVRLPDDNAGLARGAVVIEHPLQSFDQRNFCPDALIPEGPWSFDPVELDGAQSLGESSIVRGPFLSKPLPPLDSPAVQLDSLVRFLERPVRAFLRERLGWYGSGAADEVKDALPVDLDGLEQWNVGDRMLAARLAGATVAETRAAERGRGLLPPGVLGGLELQDLEAKVEALTAAAKTAISNERAVPESIEIQVRLGDGRLLIGTVPDVYETDGATGGHLRLVRCVYSQLGPRYRLAAWARFLALTAARPDEDVGAITIGRSEGKSQGKPRIALAELATLEGDPTERRAEALALLEVLVDLYDRGMCEPLPLYTKTSEKFVDAVCNEEGASAACRGVWETGSFGFGEDQEPEHQLVLGEGVRFYELLQERPRDDESGPGWGTEPSRFGRLAFRLWAPVIGHESRRSLA